MVAITMALAGLLAAPVAEELKRVDVRADLARAMDPGPARDRAVDDALAAYRALLDRHERDLKLAPRLRRRRASLLKRVGRIEEAVAEHDRIVSGRGRRKDKARALYDAAELLRRLKLPDQAERRLAKALEDYRDIANVRAKALLARGEILREAGKTKQARRAWEELVRRCSDEAKTAIAGYDALAMLALDEGDPRRARRWLERCVRCYGKRAGKPDRYGAFLSRQLGEMRAPARLAEVEATSRKR